MKFHIIGITHYNIDSFEKVKKIIKNKKQKKFFLEYDLERYNYMNKKKKKDVLFNITKELEEQKISYEFIDNDSDTIKEKFYSEVKISELIFLLFNNDLNNIKDTKFYKYFVEEREDKMLKNIKNSKFEKDIDYYIITGKNHTQSLKKKLKKIKCITNIII